MVQKVKSCASSRGDLCSLLCGSGPLVLTGQPVASIATARAFKQYSETNRHQFK